MVVTSGYRLASHTALHEILPASPAPLLLVGQNTTALAAELRALAFQVSETPLCRPEIFAQSPSATRQGVLQAELSMPQAAAASFAAVIVVDVSPQVHPLALFEQVARWLASGAVLVLVGKLLPDPPPRIQRWLEYLAAIGARCGFAHLVVADPGDGTFVRAFARRPLPGGNCTTSARAILRKLQNCFKKFLATP